MQSLPMAAIGARVDESGEIDRIRGATPRNTNFIAVWVQNPDTDRDRWPICRHELFDDVFDAPGNGIHFVYDVRRTIQKLDTQLHGYDPTT
jgi:hypothetical protein